MFIGNRRTAIAVSAVSLTFLGIVSPQLAYGDETRGLSAANAHETALETRAPVEVCGKRWPVVGLVATSLDFNWGLDRVVAVDPDGNAVLFVNSSRPIDFGDGPMGITDSISVVIAKFDTQCNLVWARAYGGENSMVFGGSIATDDAGNIFVGATLSGQVDFGNGVLTSGVMSAPLLIKLDPNGKILWSKVFPDPIDQNGGFGTNVATDAAGNVAFSGYGSAFTNFGSGPVVRSLGSLLGTVRFVAKFDRDGRNLWSRAISQADFSSRLAMEPGGAIVIAGSLAGLTRFSDTIWLSAGDYSYRYIAKLNSNGRFLWAKMMDYYDYTDVSTPLYIWIELDPSGGIIVQRQNVIPEGDAYDFREIRSIGKFDFRGNPVWYKDNYMLVNLGEYGGRGGRLSIDNSGNIAVFDEFAGVVSLGSDSLTSQGGRDLSIHEFDSHGGDAWTLQASGPYNDSTLGIAFDSHGSLFVASIEDTDSGVSATDGGNGELVFYKLAR